MKKSILFLILIPYGVFAQSQKIDSLKKALSNYPNKQVLVKTLNKIGKLYMSNNIDSALSYINNAMFIARENNNKTGQSLSYNLLANISENKGDYNEAMHLYSKSLELAIEGQDDTLKGHAINNLGIIQRKKGNLDSALILYKSALAIRQKLADTTNIGASYTNIAVVYRQKSEFSKSLDYLMRASKIFEKHGDLENVAMVYGNIGVLNSEIGDQSKAIIYFMKTADVFEKLNNKNYLSETFGNIAGCYKQLGKLSSAKQFLEKGLTLKKELGDKVGEGRMESDLAEVLFEMQNISLALDHALKAKSLLATSSDKEANYKASYVLGKIYSKTHDLNKSVLNFSEALSEAKSISDPSLICDVQKELAIVYEEQSDLPKALNAFKIYSSLKDSVLNVEKSRQLTEMQTKYETEKKDAEIALLNKDKELHAKQNTIYKATLGGVGVAGVLSVFLVFSRNRRRRDAMEKRMAEVQMQALRAQMNPHFIFNSLNSIMRFVRANDAASAEKYLGKFAKLIRMILENSREREVPLESDLQALQLYMELESLRLENKFEFSINVEEGIDKDSTYIAPMMLQPFVENSIWHGISNKEEKGNIAIRVRRENELLHCEIEDDGVGRNHASTTLSMTSGNVTLSGVEGSKSLGYAITKERVELLNRRVKKKAAVQVIDLPKGTKVLVSLPFFAEAANKN